MIDLSLDERPESYALCNEAGVPVPGLPRETIAFGMDSTRIFYAANWLPGFMGANPLETALSATGVGEKV